MDGKKSCTRKNDEVSSSKAKKSSFEQILEHSVVLLDLLSFVFVYVSWYPFVYACKMLPVQ